MIKKVDKLWGQEIWLVNEDLYCAKYLDLKKGYCCSVHYHKDKTESFYIIKGVVRLEVDNLVYTLKKGQQIKIKPWTPHRFTSLTKTARILEVSTHHEDRDSYRIKLSRKL